jgi:hypothetical protein
VNRKYYVELERQNGPGLVRLLGRLTGAENQGQDSGPTSHDQHEVTRVCLLNPSRMMDPKLLSGLELEYRKVSPRKAALGAIPRESILAKKTKISLFQEMDRRLFGLLCRILALICIWTI